MMINPVVLDEDNRYRDFISRTLRDVSDYMQLVKKQGNESRVIELAGTVVPN